MFAAALLLVATEKLTVDVSVGMPSVDKLLEHSFSTILGMVLPYHDTGQREEADLAARVTRLGPMKDYVDGLSSQNYPEDNPNGRLMRTMLAIKQEIYACMHEGAMGGVQAVDSLLVRHSNLGRLLSVIATACLLAVVRLHQHTCM